MQQWESLAATVPAKAGRSCQCLSNVASLPCRSCIVLWRPCVRVLELGRR